MNTRQIDDALKSDPIAYKRFCGVFPSDQLPKVINRFLCGFVANIDAGDESGTHWIAFYFQSEWKAEFFDSFGKPPDYYHETFKEYLNNHSVNWTFNSEQLQSVLSNVCGQYCIFFLSHRARGHSINRIVKMFDGNKNVNDRRVFRFVSRHFYMLPKTNDVAVQIRRKGV